jgi:hypothetical protein
MKPAVEAAEALTKAGIRRTKVAELPLDRDNAINKLAR